MGGAGGKRAHGSGSGLPGVHPVLPCVAPTRDAPAPIPAPTRVSTVAGVRSDGIPSPGDPTAASLPMPTVAAADAALDTFLDGPVDRYGSSAATSQVSMAPRACRRTCASDCSTRARCSPASTCAAPDHRRFQTEVVWREFYADVLHHRPDSAWASWNTAMADIRLDTGAGADEHFAAWCAGRTGYPIVDAGMRQLVAEGWMHNRVRMLTASFLVKDLHLDWTRGARFFMEHLVDGDLASNSHGWQWVAGTGTDAAPYFRIFNPDPAVAPLRPRRHLHPAVGPRTAGRYPTGRSTASERAARGLPAADRRPRHRAGRGARPLRRAPFVKPRLGRTRRSLRSWRWCVVMVRGRGRVMVGPVDTDRLGLAPAGRRVR